MHQVTLTDVITQTFSLGLSTAISSDELKNNVGYRKLGRLYTKEGYRYNILL